MSDMRNLLKNYRAEGKTRHNQPGEELSTVWKNDYISIQQVRHPEFDKLYTFLYDHGSDGQIVAVLPFRIVGGEFEFLIRNEISPAWSMEPSLNALQGGYEGGDPKDNAVREVREESGFRIVPEELIELGTARATKSTCNLYHLYAVDVTGRTQEREEGDGSQIDDISKAEWVRDVTVTDHAIVYIMYVRLAKALEERKSHG